MTAIKRRRTFVAFVLAQFLHVSAFAASYPSLVVQKLWNMPANGSGYPNFSLAGNPSPLLLFGGTTSGAYGSGVAPFNYLWINDTADHTAQGDLAPVLAISANSGGKGFIEALSVACGTLNAMTVAPGTNFLTCLEGRSGPSHNIGGTSLSNPMGQNNVMNLYAHLNPGATYWINNSFGELDIENLYGSSSLIMPMLQFVREGLDWGTAGLAGANTFGGRIGFWLNSQGPGYDGTSTGSATASAGNNLPGFTSIFTIGSPGGEFMGGSIPSGTYTKLMSVYSQIYANSNSCTVGVSNCSATTAAAIRKTNTLGWGIDLSNVNFVTSAWSTPGINILGNGETDIGNAQIVPTTSGAKLDVVGSYVSAVASYVGEDLANHAVGEYLYGTCVDSLNNAVGTVPGLIVQITSVASGVPTGFSIVQPGYSKNSASTQNGAGTQTLCGGGRVNVTLTWSTPTDGVRAALALNPTGGRVTAPGGLTADSGNGVTVSGFNLSTYSGDNMIATNNHSLFFTDTAGYHPKLNYDSSNNFALYNTDSAGGAVQVFYQKGGAAPGSPNPFVVSVPLQVPYAQTSTSYTVATLPACAAGIKGARAMITDATAPTFLGALTGGGAVVAPVFCNGTAWVAG